MVKLVSEKNTEFENSPLSEVHMEFSNIVRPAESYTIRKFQTIFERNF